MIGAFLARHPRLANRLYGFTPPERGTVVLVHRRVYIVPTRLGWLYAGTLLVLLVGSINYALSLGFALTFLLAGMGLVAMVHTARNLARMAISTGRAEPVFAGEAAHFRLYLDGQAPYDRPAILVRHLGSGVETLVDIAPHGQAQVRLAIPTARRGWQPLGRLLLETRFPTGLFRAWSYAEPDARCLVYPRPERSPLPAPTPLEEQGARATPSAGNEDFATLRSYQPSDSPRHVAWKAYARTDDMLTKQFTGEAASELWLDWQRLPAGLDTEGHLSRLAGWVLQAEAAGARFGLRIPGQEIAAGRGDAHTASCLQALALFQTEAP